MAETATTAGHPLRRQHKGLVVISSARELRSVSPDTRYTVTTGYQEWASPPLFIRDGQLIVGLVAAHVAAMRRMIEVSHPGHEPDATSYDVFVPPAGQQMASLEELLVFLECCISNPRIGLWDPALCAVVETQARYTAKNPFLQFLVPPETTDRLVVGKTA